MSTNPGEQSGLNSSPATSFKCEWLYDNLDLRLCADIGYTHGFYRELTPALLSLVPLAQGKQGLDTSAPLAYCELGCGQGFSANLLAAANSHIEFYSNDFNPTQIAGAMALAAEACAPNIYF